MEGKKAMMAVDELRQDVRYALRSIRRAPGYAGLVILTLAFGIAANTTIFSVMNPYLVRPLPFEDPDELVQVNVANPVTGWDMDRFSYPQYADWKARSRAFDDLGAYVYGSASVTGVQAPEQIQYTRLTPNMLDVLGVRMARGRGLIAEDGRPGAEPVVLLDHGLWERRYAADVRISSLDASPTDGAPSGRTRSSSASRPSCPGATRTWTAVWSASRSSPFEKP